MQNAAREIEIKSFNIETDSSKANRIWLWMRIECDRSTPSEIRISGADGDERRILFVNAHGKQIPSLTLGYHRLFSGTTELPPMPVTLRSPIHLVKNLKVEIKSVRDKDYRFESEQRIYFKPYLISGRKER